jgi:hypothetical protein
MSLNVVWRGVVEEIIEETLRNIPSIVTGARSIKTDFYLTTENEEYKFDYDIKR